MVKKLKVSELRAMVKEAVSSIVAEQAAQPAPCHECDDMKEGLAELQEMLDSMVKEAFGEVGDSNGAHVGGTFGDGEKPATEAVDEGKKTKVSPKKLLKDKKK